MMGKILCHNLDYTIMYYYYGYRPTDFRRKKNQHNLEHIDEVFRGALYYLTKGRNTNDMNLKTYIGCVLCHGVL